MCFPEPGTKPWEKAVIKALSHPRFSFIPSKKLYQLLPEKRPDVVYHKRLNKAKLFLQRVVS